jgi:hypothetical protein
MFQLLVNYLGDRYVSVFIEKPIKEYRLLVEHIKSAIACFNKLQNNKIRIAYKDVHSGCFINIHANVDEQFHLTDNFNNVEHHPEHLDEVRNIKKQVKGLTKEVDNLKSEKKNVVAFQSRSISAFATAAFPDKYSLKTASGKLDLQKDMAKLRMVCHSKAPENTGEDKS